MQSTISRPNDPSSIFSRDQNLITFQEEKDQYHKARTLSTTSLGWYFIMPCFWLQIIMIENVNGSDSGRFAMHQLSGTRRLSVLVLFAPRSLCSKPSKCTSSILSVYTDTELLAPPLCADSESTPWKVTTLKFFDKKQNFNIPPPTPNVYIIHFELFYFDLPLLARKLFPKCSNSPEKEEFRRALKMYDKDKTPLTFPQRIRIAAVVSDDFQNECAEILSFQWHYFITA